MLVLLWVCLPVVVAVSQTCGVSHDEFCDAVNVPSLLTVGSSFRRAAEGRVVADAAAQGSTPLSALARSAASIGSAAAQLRKATSGLRLARRRSTGAPDSADWFGAFSEGESTYAEDFTQGETQAFNERTQTVTEPIGARDDPYGARPDMPAEWFKETVSGGDAEAWQTYYPAIATAGHKPSGSADIEWLNGQQYYSHVSDGSVFKAPDTKNPSWFDDSVTQYDAFGRARRPIESSARAFVDWTRRTRNVSLHCAAAGCIANASILAFDVGTEQRRHCYLSIGLHATDFGDEFSRERVEWITVNGQTVNAKCDPMASGCNETGIASMRPLYPCLADLELTDSVLATGQLNISGKINSMVDECPVDGNLLSGVASVTCYVRTTPEPEAPTSAAGAEPVEPTVPSNVNVTALLQCKDPGCEASAELRLGPEAANKTCTLTVSFNQTDFDDSIHEEIVFVKVDGEISKEHLKPGRNPCLAATAATGSGGSAASNPPFVAIDAEDATAAVADGLVRVSAKLSDRVDECGSNGFLLDGLVSVICV